MKEDQYVLQHGQTMIRQINFITDTKQKIPFITERDSLYLKTDNYIYASIGSHVQTRFRSPYASSTLETEAKNLWSLTHSNG
jgi:hypothetical protein